LGRGSDQGAVAETFAAASAFRLRYDHEAGRWFRWDRVRWRRDDQQETFHEIAAFAKAHAAVLEKPRDRIAARRAAFAGGVERLARADPLLRTTGALWDADPFLLGTPGGTVDLRSGELRAADPGDYITRLAAVAPDMAARHPIWTAFLEEATGEDEGLQRFLQAFAGYCLSGLTREHVFAFLYGSGGNGESVFADTLRDVLGDYGAVADMATFTAAALDRHSTELAALRGARLLTASETGEARTWDEARIKALTGGDPITARVMRGDPFTYRPQFKLLFLRNAKPALRSVDEAMRRRIRVVPFTRRPREVDPELGEKLKAEAPAILAWAIRGAFDWQELGLWSPPAVRAASDEYLSDEDVRAAWCGECCERRADAFTTSAALFASWKTFAEARGERPGTAKRLGNALSQMGFEPATTRQGGNVVRGWNGVRLLDESVTHRAPVTDETGEWI
jgi:putative DNA primase/helicase